MLKRKEATMCGKPICHFTPMEYVEEWEDDTYPYNKGGSVFKCKHCGCQKASTENGWEVLKNE